MEFDGVRIVRVNALCDLVQLLGDPIDLRLEEGNAT